MNGFLGTYLILRESYRAFEDDDGVAMAGYIAFSMLLAIFPFMIFAVTLTGILLGQDQSQAAVDALFRFAPAHIAQTLEPVLSEVLQDRGQGVLTLSFLVTLWLASNAVEAFRVAFDRAYNVEESRHFIWRRAIAIGFVLLGAIVAVILGICVLFAPLLLQMAERWFDVHIPGSTAAVSFLLGLAVFALFLTMMHRFLPGKSMKGSRLWPGILLSIVLWLFGALGFSTYISMTPTYAITYGTLAGVMVTLIFFYLSGVAVIIGAEVNAVLNRAAKTLS
ncbi:MAG: YihY/virulence factor BrkB family protein [Paracoccaceae bacterium]